MGAFRDGVGMLKIRFFNTLTCAPHPPYSDKNSPKVQTKFHFVEKFFPFMASENSGFNMPVSDTGMASASQVHRR
jgi:hypothetical protein